MPLSLKIKELGTNTDGSAISLKDATGDYAVTDNEGGYGAPNKTRLEVALVVVARSIRMSEEVLLEVFPYDPVTVESFSIPLTYDGWLQVEMFAIDVFITGQSYSENDIVYDKADKQVKKYVSGEFVAIEQIALLDIKGLTRVQYNRLIPIKITSVLSDINKSMINAADDDEFTDWERRYDLVYGHLNGAKEYFCAKSYYEAQKIMEVAEDYYKQFCK